MRQLTFITEKLGLDYFDIVTIDKQIRKKLNASGEMKSYSDVEVKKAWKSYKKLLTKMVGRSNIRPAVEIKLKRGGYSLVLNALDEVGALNESKASEQAEKMGLEYMNFGRFGKNGKVTHKEVGDKLVPTHSDDTGERDSQEKDSTDTSQSTDTFKQDTDAQGQQPAPKKPNVFDKPKLTDLMPKAKIPTKSLMSKITHGQKRRIAIMMDKLFDMARDAVAKGEKAPNYNLCQVHIPGTNLFCGGNLGVPRLKMPQFKGKTRPGSVADKLPKNEKGEVDADHLFLQSLEKSGIKVVGGSIPSDRLKSTQNQLIGPKIAGMAKALEKNPKHEFLTAPIYVSRDGYVLDGHHRWGANVAVSMKKEKPMRMKVNIIDKDIKDLLPMAQKYAEKIGIEQAGA